MKKVSLPDENQKSGIVETNKYVRRSCW